MSKRCLSKSEQRTLYAHSFAYQLVKIENNIDAVVSLVFQGFHKLGFERVRIYRYRNGKCYSWRCCERHAPDVRALFDDGQIVLSANRAEPDNFASMDRDKTPLIIVYDPKCGRCEPANDSGRQVFLTDKDPWYDKLGKPHLDEGQRFEWLDCPLLIGNRILGKISMDRGAADISFSETDLALTAPLSFLIASVMQRNPVYEYDVFLSYHDSQHKLAQDVFDILRERRVKTFFARRTIPPGHKFGSDIQKAILESNYILALFSPECKGSDWVYTECAAHWLLGKPLLVLRVGGALVNDLPFFMRDIQSPEYSFEELLRFVSERFPKESYTSMLI